MHLIVVDDEEASSRHPRQLARDGHGVAIEELDQICHSDAPVTAGRTEGSDAPFVDPLLHRARIHLQEVAHFMRRQQPVRVDFWLSHDFDVLTGNPVLVNGRELCLRGYFPSLRQCFDALIRAR